RSREPSTRRARTVRCSRSAHPTATDCPPGDLSMNLVPTAELIKLSHMRFPNESVAEQRRALTPGGEVTGDYRFQDEHGPLDLAGLFGDRQSLVVYSYMFGPQRERPCPMCTSLLSAWDGEARDVGQRVALAVVARSPIERLVGFARERGWRHLKLYSDLNGNYSRDYFGIDSKGGDDAAFTVFTRRDGVIRHFWSGEMGSATADPGQDPRGAPDLMPLWTILDCT